jgi:DNA-binding transcriptional MocR family regulator
LSSFRLDTHIVDVLLRDLVGHERSAAAFLVYLVLWRHTRGAQQRKVRLSHRAIAEETSLSKSAVQQAMRKLHRRKLVASTRQRPTDTPEHVVLRPWRKPGVRHER